MAKPGIPPGQGVTPDPAPEAARRLDEAWAAEAWMDVRPPVVRRLMIAATQEFAARGYHGTTTRDIAARAGLSPAGVYVHFRSKEELLFRISRVGHQHALDDIRRGATAEDPVRRLRDLVARFSAWHARYHVPARVIQYEMGALTAEHRAEVAALRRGIDSVVRETLEYGVERGVFDVPDLGGAALVLLSLAIDVARWYRPEGSWTPESIGALHADLAVRMFTR